MGVAAYYRGNKAISDGIARDFEAQRKLSSRAERIYEAGLDAGRAESEAEIRHLRVELERATLRLRLLAATLTEERRRVREAVDGLERLREGYRGKAGPGAYAAIVALLRTRRALGFGD